MKLLILILCLGLFQTTNAEELAGGWNYAWQMYLATNDHESSFKRFKVLAEQGNYMAQHQLGWMYQKGEGVKRNHKEAAHWYRKAAEQGDTLAQIDLGLMYAYGQEEIQNYIKAHAWLSVAGSRGQHIANVERVKVAELMLPEQILRAQLFAEELAAVE